MPGHARAGLERGRILATIWIPSPRYTARRADLSVLGWHVRVCSRSGSVLTRSTVAAPSACRATVAPWFHAVRVSRRASWRDHRDRYAAPRPARSSLRSHTQFSAAKHRFADHLTGLQHGNAVPAEVHRCLAAEQDVAGVRRSLLMNQRPWRGRRGVACCSDEMLHVVVREVVECGELA